VDQLFELYRPDLRDPVVLSAFAGWNDAAEVATGALRFLMRQWSAEPCAEIDPEDFFVFTETRPQVRIVDRSQRRISWPQNHFYHARPPGSDRDILFLVGTEPQLKWRTFTSLILDYVSAHHSRLFISLGGLLAEVLHSRPAVLTGSIGDPELTRRVARLGLHRSRYEGPTGIVGVIGASCRDRGIASGSIWGNVPHYISSMSNPPVMSALVRSVSELLDLPVDLSELDRSTIRFNAEVARAIDGDKDVGAYIKQLEEQDAPGGRESPSSADTPSASTELPDASDLVQELDDFFRRGGQPPSE
jgi:proteasome assembly chaperone (PAC2) family protein